MCSSTHTLFNTKGTGKILFIIYLRIKSIFYLQCNSYKGSSISSTDFTETNGIEKIKKEQK